MEDLKNKLERVFLEVLPKAMPIIEKPEFHLIGHDEFHFQCLVRVFYREDEKDGGFKVKFVQKFKISNSDPDFIANSVRFVASEVAVCSCFAKNGAQHVGV